MTVFIKNYIKITKANKVINNLLTLIVIT